MNGTEVDINKVEEYKKKLIEYNVELKKLLTEHDSESHKNPKDRTRKLSEINADIQKLNQSIYRLKPKKKCSCGWEIDYDTLICWNCGEVFLDICPKCKSSTAGANEWGLVTCSSCGFQYRDTELLEDFLVLSIEPSGRFHKVLDTEHPPSVQCYNIGVKRNTIWQLCKNYACPFEKQCEHYCPAFLAILGLIWRGRVTTALPWGYEEGGSLIGYKIRWKRAKWQAEEY